ncbi:MAG: GNAT family N-acetyltransferase [Pseudomonadota bacterium]|nr:MAG: GNAT family N-acetyltransferase [Pseudomonadota bacterium]
MDNQSLYRLARDLLKTECEFFAGCSLTGRVVRWPGVMISVIPAAPDRSIFNWVIYDKPDLLFANYDAISATYNEAGVRAWTVWTDAGDNTTGPALVARGHKPDGNPVAMAAPMTDMALPDLGDLDWSTTDDISIIGRVNDAAYGFPPPAFEAALTRWADASCHGYAARLNGDVVGVTLAHEDENGDCGISGVATLPEARGHGIATRLLAVALREAQRRGCKTTSLQASALGAKVYASLGYHNVGVMGMWERRKPSS